MRASLYWQEFSGGRGRQQCILGLLSLSAVRFWVLSECVRPPCNNKQALESRGLVRHSFDSGWLGLAQLGSLYTVRVGLRLHFRIAWASPCIIFRNLGQQETVTHAGSSVLWAGHTSTTSSQGSLVGTSHMAPPNIKGIQEIGRNSTCGRSLESTRTKFLTQIFVKQKIIYR